MIKFSPPDISEQEINNVIVALKSGWITTGPKTKEFEKRIAEYCGTQKAVCLNSATACLELTLKILGIGVGDEVITSSYTYTASASVIEHVGAKIVLIDTQPDSYEMDYNCLEAAINQKTKAVIPVDIAGKPCDYERIFQIVQDKKSMFSAHNDLQKAIGRVAVVADAAHSFGAVYKGKRTGRIADFTSFSFHAVKNLTTAEGGAVTWNPVNGIDSDWIYNEYMLWSLHGQNKDALAKTAIGCWEYDIACLGQKCNMTDIMAAIGLAQLERYPQLLKRRQQLIERYDKILAGQSVEILNHNGADYLSSGHLYLTRVIGIDEGKRNRIIRQMAEHEIATNVHYKPLPMHTAYKRLGFKMNDFPNAFNQYKNEITLPLHTLLTDNDAEFVANTYVSILRGISS